MYVRAPQWREIGMVGAVLIGLLGMTAVAQGWGGRSDPSAGLDDDPSVGAYPVPAAGA